MGLKNRIKAHLMRVMHLSICLAIMLPLLLLPSELHRMTLKQEDLPHGSAYLIFFAATCVAYLIASFTNPGYLTPEKARLFRHRRGQLSDCGNESVHSNDQWENSLNDSSDALEVQKTGNASPHAQAIYTDYIPDTTEETDGVKPDRTSLMTDILCCPISSVSLRQMFNSHMDTAVLYEDPVVTLSVPVRFCKHCLLEQPLRCRHCPDCGRCVIKFDHHCPWIGNCIGERNHSSFVVFLLFQVILIWWTLYLAWASIVPSPIWADWFRYNGLFVAEISILLLLGVPVTILLGFQTYLALASRTTWETVAYERIVYLNHLDDRSNPFNQGCARNCYAFCCSRYPFGWDLIYAEAVGQPPVNEAFERQQVVVVQNPIRSETVIESRETSTNL